MVTYEALFAYTAAIAAVISVVLQILDHTKRSNRLVHETCSYFYNTVWGQTVYW